MKYDILISVIVPVFNAEKYLDACLNCIVNQTYSNLQIILIEDGSPDRCPQMCDTWAKRDGRIQVIHKENFGAAVAKNEGLKVTKGDYVGFVDSDDLIELDMFEKLINAAIDNNSDISMCRMERIEGERKFVTRDFFYNGDAVILEPIEACRELLHDRIDTSHCTKLFRRELLDNIKFPTNNTNEEFIVVFRMFLASERIVYIRNVLYHYIMRNNSVTNSGFSIKQFDKYYNRLIVQKQVQEENQELIVDVNHSIWYQGFCLLKYSLLHNLQRDFHKECAEIRNSLRTGSKEILNSKELTLREKGMYLVIGYLPSVYRMKHLLHRR